MRAHKIWCMRTKTYDLYPAKNMMYARAQKYNACTFVKYYLWMRARKRKVMNVKLDDSRKIFYHNLQKSFLFVQDAP